MASNGNYHRARRSRNQRVPQLLNLQIPHVGYQHQQVPQMVNHQLHQMENQQMLQMENQQMLQMGNQHQQMLHMENQHQQMLQLGNQHQQMLHMENQHQQMLQLGNQHQQMFQMGNQQVPEMENSSDRLREDLPRHSVNEALFHENDSRYLLFPWHLDNNHEIPMMYRLTGWLPRKFQRIGWVHAPAGAQQTWELVVLPGDFMLYVPVYTPVGPYGEGPGCLRGFHGYMYQENMEHEGSSGYEHEGSSGIGEHPRH